MNLDFHVWLLSKWAINGDSVSHKKRNCVRQVRRRVIKVNAAIIQMLSNFFFLSSLQRFKIQISFIQKQTERCASTTLIAMKLLHRKCFTSCLFAWWGTGFVFSLEIRFFENKIRLFNVEKTNYSSLYSEQAVAKLNNCRNQCIIRWSSVWKYLNHFTGQLY